LAAGVIACACATAGISTASANTELALKARRRIAVFEFSMISPFIIYPRWSGFDRLKYPLPSGGDKCA